MKRYIILKKLAELKTLLINEKYKGGPDNSILVKAMADYIKFSNAQIGMPVLVEVNNVEYLQDGVNLIEALLKSDYFSDVACIQYSSSIKQPHPPYLEYSLSEAEKMGSETRLITFDTKIEDWEMNLLNKEWSIAPVKVNEYSIGWNGEKARLLSDWLTWLTSINLVSKNIKKIAAINGRYFKSANAFT